MLSRWLNPQQPLLADYTLHFLFDLGTIWTRNGKKHTRFFFSFILRQTAAVVGGGGWEEGFRIVIRL